jgi:hypothetical protein
LIVIGTRVASVDLYRELRQEDRYPGGLVPWKYLAMPALLETNEDPDKWVTLWPHSDMPFDGQTEAEQNEEGLYPRWSGRNLYNERQAMDASTWAWSTSNRTYPRTQPLTQYVYVALLMECASPADLSQDIQAILKT